MSVLEHQTLHVNLNKKRFLPKTHPLLLIVLIGCAAGSKLMIGRDDAKIIFFLQFCLTETTVHPQNNSSQSYCRIDLNPKHQPRSFQNQFKSKNFIDMSMIRNFQTHQKLDQ